MQPVLHHTHCKLGVQPLDTDVVLVHDTQRQGQRRSLLMGEGLQAERVLTHVPLVYMQGPPEGVWRKSVKLSIRILMLEVGKESLRCQPCQHQFEEIHI